MKLHPLEAVLKFLVVLAMLPAFGSTMAQTGIWQHPGVYVGQAQLDFVTAQVNAHVEPYYQEFLNAKASSYGGTSYTIQGPYAGGVNQCGSSSNPNNGCSAADSDSAAAYVQAVLWYITGNQTYANNAIAIMNAYAYNFKGYGGTTGGPACPGASSTCSNGPLQAGWDAAKWPRAAEIIRYGHGGSAGWLPADVAAFSTMLTNLYEPAIYAGSSSNGNWELAMIEGMMGIAVFNEDAALMQHAQTFWTQRVESYFYYQPVDGNTQPAFPSGRQGSTTWNGQTVFNASTSGVTQETCRDLGHTEYGISAAIAAAETDYIQSGHTANLYASQQERLVAAMNVNSGFELAKSTTVALSFCGGTITLSNGPTYVIAYNEFHNRLDDPNMAGASGTTGVQGTSNTYQWIQSGVLPETQPYDGGAHLTVFEPLTHYGDATSATGNFALSSSPTTQAVTAGASTSYTITVTPSGGYGGNVALSVLSGLPAGASASFSPTTLSGGSGTSALTVTTSTSTPIASSTLQVSGTDGTLTNGTSITLNVTASSATITANNQTMPAGAAVPALTYTVSPTGVSLTTAPTCTTTGTSTSAAGTYPVTCSGAVATGYVFTYTAGTLTITAVVNPTPTIASLTPAKVTAGSGAVTLSVAGTGFMPGSMVNLNGTSRTTIYVSATQLMVALTASDVATTGEDSLTVANPAPSGGISSVFTIAVDTTAGAQGAFSISATVTQTVAQGGSVNVPVTFAGLNSTATEAAVCYNLPAGTTCSYSSGALMFSATSATPKATYQVLAVFTGTEQVSALRGTGGVWYAAGLLLLLGGARRPRRRMGARLLVLMIGALMTAALSGCGAGSASSGGTPPQTVHGQESIAFNLIVQ
jgi:hypothetical protein